MGYNRLINETSTYLVGHAHQEIDWYPWCDEAFERAKAENKLIFISIGFSACHWCHEISRNCFENEIIAQTLNRYFINIKVDREERPDVDLFYMNVIEIITNSGGWPISCFTLPDGSPVYGGTYFPPDQFMEVILGLQQTYEDEPERLEEIGNEIMEMLKDADVIKEKKPIEKITLDDVKLVIEPWRRKFDLKHGGTTGAPKFPLPISLMFMMYSAYYLEDQSLMDYVEITLDNIAKGGIYDQLEGGIFRYAEDVEWKKPHFEKMLFDNAQLIIVYCLAYRNKPKALYKDLIDKSISFMRKTGVAENGMLYGSIDAEVDEIEGGYYTWRASEIREALNNEDYDFAIDYFGIKEENDVRNVLFINDNVENLAKKYCLSVEESEEKIEKIKKILSGIREKRPKPNIDKKIILGWNSMAIGALCEAYRTFGDKSLLDRAIQMADYIIDNYIEDDFKMYRIIENKTPAFLDDYSLTANGLMRLYRVAGDNKYLKVIKGIIDYTFKHFYDEKSGMFFLTDDTMPSRLPRMMDFVDKAYPSSNSVMVRVLTMYSLISGDMSYAQYGRQMICNIKGQMAGAGPYVSYWAYMLFIYIFKPVMAFVPKDKIPKIHLYFAPNLMVFPENSEIKGMEYTGAIVMPEEELKKIDGNISEIVKFARMNKKIR